jgi:biotin synthase
MQDKLAELIKKTLTGEEISRDEYAVLIAPETETYDLLYGAHLLREHYKGDAIDLCAIVNAKSGKCAEDCAFCAQSARHSADVKTYPLLSAEVIEAASAEAAAIGAHHFGIVASGESPTDSEVRRIAKAVQYVREKSGLPVDVSLGRLTRQQLRTLHEAGVRRIHCNLETSERFFPKICTTHSWQSKVETLRAAKAEGFELCSGGLFGMGETWQDRLDLALSLKDLAVDSVPLNFLAQVPGTPLSGAKALSPLECLRIIALFRYILPQKDIRVCGGRAVNLRALQSWIFYAGANAAMIGNYLTTPGNPPEEDLQMIRDLGLKARNDKVGDC